MKSKTSTDGKMNADGGKIVKKVMFDIEDFP